MIKRFNLRVIGLSVQWIKIYFNNICKSTKWISHKYNRNFLEYLDQWNLKLLSQFTQTILWEIASEPEFQYYPEIETNKRQNATIFCFKTHIYETFLPRKSSPFIIFRNASVHWKKICKNLRTIKNGEQLKAKIINKKWGTKRPNIVLKDTFKTEAPNLCTVRPIKLGDRKTTGRISYDLESTLNA